MLSSGSSVSFDSDAVEVIVDADNLFTFIIYTSANGNWVLSLDNVPLGNVFQVEVTARSFVDFVFQILEVGDSGSLVPTDGLPIAGIMYYYM